MKGERTCIGCGRKASKRELVRVCRDANGAIGLDPTRRAPGRGAYLCSRTCLEKAVNNGRLAQALRVRLPKDINESIAANPVWQEVEATEDGKE